MKILELVRENYPVYIDITIIGCSSIDFKLDGIGWVSNPRIRLLPPYGGPDYYSVRHLLIEVVDYLSKIEIVPHDNIATHDSNAAKESKWLNSVIDEIKSAAEEDIHIEDFQYMSSLGTVIDVQFGVRF